MHDWYGFTIWLGILFVVLPALVGGAIGFALYRRKFGGGGASLQGIIGGAVIGAAAGGGFAVLLLAY
jgi:hypothetical protein